MGLRPIIDAYLALVANQQPSNVEPASCVIEENVLQIWSKLCPGRLCMTSPMKYQAFKQTPLRHPCSLVVPTANIELKGVRTVLL